MLLQLLLLLTIRRCVAFDFPNATSMARIFHNDGGISSSSNQDIYMSTVHLTGFFSGIYNLGFVNSTSSPSLYTLAILMNTDPNFPGDPDTTMRVVWEANRDDPVKLNATLTLQNDGNLVLRDVDSRLVWSTGTANIGATKVQIEKNGNLVVSNSTGGILWQSFDHPSDTLLVNQIFRPGMKLQSRKNIGDSSVGSYSLVMEAGGLVLYYNNSGSVEPYWVRGYYGQDDLATALQTCDSLATAALDGTGLVLRLSMSLSNVSGGSGVKSPVLCNMNKTQDLVLRQGNNPEFNRSFIRLESDGNLRGYILGRLSRWEATYELFQHTQSCSIPARCQPFGVCSNGTCTSCVNSNDGWTDKCLAPKIDSCTDTESLEFIQMQPGIEYFSSKYLTSPSMSLDDCKNRCINNCSCSAVFYWQESGKCFTLDKLSSLQRVSNGSHLAFLKATKPEETWGISKGTVAGIVVGALVLVVAASSVICYCVRRRKLPAVDYDSDDFLESLEISRPMRFSHADLDVITNRFSTILGTGGFGTVYEGLLPDGRKVAVKRLERTSGQGKREFYAEVGVLGNIHHWNLVKLLGFCSSGSHRLLVYEYMPNGSLDRWIFPTKEEDEGHILDWNTRMGILQGTARGLAYLHEECREKVIHLDIKPQNILLGDSFIAKVADFGLSRLMARDQSFVVTNMRGTPGYLAPEWLLEAAITEKCDVYGFGIVLLEVVSGRKNFTRISETDKFYLPAYALELVSQSRDVELLDSRLDPSTVDEKEVMKVLRIAFQCIREDAGSRPSMGKVVQMLEGLCDVPREVPSRETFFAMAKNLEVTTSSTVFISDISLPTAR